MLASRRLPTHRYRVVASRNRQALPCGLSAHRKAHPMTTPPPAPQPAAPQPAGPLTEAEDKQWASFAHFGGAIVLLGLFSGWVGLLGILPALIIFLVFGKRGARTLVESKEALNFQITALALLCSSGRSSRASSSTPLRLLWRSTVSRPGRLLRVGSGLGPPSLGDHRVRRDLLDHRWHQGAGRRLVPLPLRHPPHQVTVSHGSRAFGSGSSSLSETPPCYSRSRRTTASASNRPRRVSTTLPADRRRTVDQPVPDQPGNRRLPGSVE